MIATLSRLHLILFVLFFFLSGLSVNLLAQSQKPGVDVGGSIDNSSAVLVPAGEMIAKSPDQKDLPDVNHVSMDQTDYLRIWFSTYFSETVGFLIKANVEYAGHYSFVTPIEATPKQPVFWDIEYFVFNDGIVDAFGTGTKLNLWIGRTDFTDFSGIVLNSKLDGVLLDAGSPDFNIHFGAGTSALTFKNSSAIAISTADVVERDNVSTWDDPTSILAPPRLIGDLEFQFKRLFLDQNLTIGAIGQLDMRKWFDGTSSRFPGVASAGDLAADPSHPNEGPPVSMLYSGLNLKGKIVGPLYYNAWGYFGYGKTLTAVGVHHGKIPGHPPIDPVYQTYADSDIVNGAGSVDFTVLLPEAAYSIIDLNATLGSWDTDASSSSVGTNGSDPSDINKATQYNGFFGITRTGGQIIFNPQLVNMLTTQLSYSFKPFSDSNDPVAASFQAVLIGSLFIRPVAAPIGEDGLDKLNPSPLNYLGTEADLILNLRPSSDLGGSLGFGVFTPEGGALDRKLELKAEFSLSMSL